MTESLEALCRELEHFETSKWAADAILPHKGIVRLPPFRGEAVPRVLPRYPAAHGQDERTGLVPLSSR